MQEALVKRTIWIAECPICHEKEEQTEYRVRERFCNKCQVWAPYAEKSYTGLQ